MRAVDAALDGGHRERLSRHATLESELRNYLDSKINRFNSIAQIRTLNIRGARDLLLGICRCAHADTVRGVEGSHLGDVWHMQESKASVTTTQVGSAPSGPTPRSLSCQCAFCIKITVLPCS